MCLLEGVCICMFVCALVPMCLYGGRPRVNLSYHFSGTVHLVGGLEGASVVVLSLESEAYQLVQARQPVSSRNLPVSASPALGHWDYK